MRKIGYTKAKIFHCEKSVYATFEDIVDFVRQKYSLGEINNFTMKTDH